MDLKTQKAEKQQEIIIENAITRHTPESDDCLRRSKFAGELNAITPSGQSDYYAKD